MLALLDPSQTVEYLVPTTELSDRHRPRTLFLGPRKEWQGFKNKVTDKGGAAFGQLTPEREFKTRNHNSGAYSSQIWKWLVLTAFCQEMSLTPQFSFPFVTTKVIVPTSRKLRLPPVSFCFQLIKRLICYLLCLCWTHPACPFQIYLFGPPQPALNP